MTRTKPCTAADARALARYAAAYLDTATRVRDEGGEGSDHVATGNAVLAAIAASDASDARQLADALMRALDTKDAAHYGVAAVARDAQVRAVRAAETLVAVAREVTA